MLKYSNYNIDFEDEGEIVVFNLLSSSVIKLTNDKFEALKSLNLSQVFSDEEVSLLLDMGFITERDEYGFICESRKKYYDKQEQTDFHLTILTTSDCNARCYYCYERGVKKQPMTFAVAQQVYNHILENRNGKDVCLHWFGGEPLYNAEVIDYICGKLKEEGIKYSSNMITNGFLIGENKSKIINSWNLQRVQITIDAVGEEYNKIKNFIYKGVDAFETVINNIELLLNNDVYVAIRINYDPNKIENAKNTLKYIHKKFGNHSKLNVYCAWIEDDKILRPQQWIDTTHPIVELYSMLIDFGYITRLEDLAIRPRLLNCGIHWKDFAVINVDGQLFKCQAAIMNENQSSFGSIYDGVTKVENKRIWESTDFPYEECRECRCLPICQGGCKFKAINNQKDYVCTNIKTCVEEVVKLFYYKILKEGD